MNEEWVLAQLAHFGAILAGRIVGLDDQRMALLEMQPILERIFERVWGSKWSDRLVHSRYSEFQPWQELGLQTAEWVRRKAEVEAALGPSGPTLSVEALHPAVWSAAVPFWDTGQHQAAVAAAAAIVNSRIQVKVGRRDVSDAKLVQETFSSDDPMPGRPRLRVMKPDDSEDYRSLQAGVRDFGSGCFKALRNLAVHGIDLDVSEPEALEAIAAFSRLARWIDEAERVEG